MCVSVCVSVCFCCGVCVFIINVRILCLQAQIFDTFESLNASDFNLEVGAVAFVLDTSLLYILTEDGWISAVVRLVA